MGMSGKRHPLFRRTGMNNADKIIKRCRALALAGMIGITSLEVLFQPLLQVRG